MNTLRWMTSRIRTPTIRTSLVISLTLNGLLVATPRPVSKQSAQTGTLILMTEMATAPTWLASPWEQEIVIANISDMRREPT